MSDPARWGGRRCCRSAHDELRTEGCVFGFALGEVEPLDQHLIPQQRFDQSGGRSTRRPVMAVAGLLLAFASPGRPVHDVVDAGLRGEDERGEEAAGLVARQRDQPTMAGRGSPFSASRPCSVARVTARRMVHADGTGGFAGAYPWIVKTTGVGQPLLRLRRRRRLRHVLCQVLLLLPLQRPAVSQRARVG